MNKDISNVIFKLDLYVLSSINRSFPFHQFLLQHFHDSLIILTTLRRGVLLHTDKTLNPHRLPKRTTSSSSNSELILVMSCLIEAVS